MFSCTFSRHSQSENGANWCNLNNEFPADLRFRVETMDPLRFIPVLPKEALVKEMRNSSHDPNV